MKNNIFLLLLFLFLVGKVFAQDLSVRSFTNPSNKETAHILSCDDNKMQTLALKGKALYFCELDLDSKTESCIELKSHKNLKKELGKNLHLIAIKLISDKEGLYTLFYSDYDRHKRYIYTANFSIITKELSPAVKIATLEGYEKIYRSVYRSLEYHPGHFAFVESPNNKYHILIEYTQATGITATKSKISLLYLDSLNNVTKIDEGYINLPLSRHGPYLQKDLLSNNFLPNYMHLDNDGDFFLLAFDNNKKKIFNYLTKEYSAEAFLATEIDRTSFQGYSPVLDESCVDGFRLQVLDYQPTTRKYNLLDFHSKEGELPVFTKSVLDIGFIEDIQPKDFTENNSYLHLSNIKYFDDKKTYVLSIVDEYPEANQYGAFKLTNEKHTSLANTFCSGFIFAEKVSDSLRLLSKLNTEFHFDYNFYLHRPHPINNHTNFEIESKYYWHIYVNSGIFNKNNNKIFKVKYDSGSNGVLGYIYDSNTKNASEVALSYKNPPSNLINGFYPNSFIEPTAQY